MIYSNISLPRSKSIYSPAIMKVLDFLATADFSTMEPGRHPIDGNDIFILLNTSTTSPSHERRAEAHKKYIDIQFMIEGVEDIGFACLSKDITVDEDLLDEKDIIFYSDVKNESFVTLRAGDFAILFPEDIHRPLCKKDGCDTVRKVVGKVAVDAL